jgi:1A family penicillin-binding protein
MISPTIKRRVKKILLWTEILFILVLGAGMGVVLGAFYQMNKLLPPDAALEHYRAPVGTTIWSNDGKLLAKLAEEDRSPVALEKIPKHMRDAMVAIEDSRFYQHSGLDYRGLARALWANVRGQEMAQGGSTITQQLARNMFLSQKKKLSRKIKEILLAVQIERNWPKSRILEAYLNQVYFGAGAYGVKTAAQVYFGKDYRKLTLEEAALLAGLPQRPSELSPFTAFKQDGNYDRSKRRRDMVLNRMAELGFVPREKAEQAMAKPVKVVKEKGRTIGFYRAKYFVQHVMDELKAQGFDEELLDKAGYRIVTTLNWKMQEVAEREAAKGVARWRGARVSEAALVCVDPHTGYIRALVGGVNQPWEKFQFNCATQAMRQPGSSFKGFVYAAALERGDSPYSSVAAAAKAVSIGGGKFYAPKNHGKYGGMMSYVSAFAGSVNGAAHNVCLKVGPKAVVNMARRLGLKGNLRAYASIALGASEATPLEMASAYGVFAAKGKRAEPTTILQIRDHDDKVLEEFQPKVTDTGLKPSTISGMDTLTRAVVTGGTGGAARIVPDAHGKTGTSEEYTDAWFVGYTPDLATAVWCGNRNNSQMAHIYGGTIAAPIWAGFMKEAVELNPARKKKPLAKAKTQERKKAPREETRREERPTPVVPAFAGDGSERNRITVNVCPDSGLLAGPNCSSRVPEDHMLGEQPMQRCTLSHTRKKPAKEKEKEPEKQPGTPEEDKPGTADAGDQ